MAEKSLQAILKFREYFFEIQLDNQLNIKKMQILNFFEFFVILLLNKFKRRQRIKITEKFFVKLTQILLLLFY